VRLLVVIVSWNARQELERCLRSLLDAPPMVPHSIVVVDNASTDGSADMVAGTFPSVRLIRSPENLGFARGNNLALRRETSEMILLLNPDTIVPPAAIDTLVARLVAHPEAAAAGPRIIDANGRPELSFGSMPAPVTEARQKILTRLHGSGIAPFSAIVRRMTSRERLVDWVSGACLLVRRPAAEAVGLLDERYQLYWEDVDFCSALRRQGWRILFTPAAQIVHLRGRSASVAPRPTSRAYREGQLAFYAKHHPRWLPLLRWYQKVRYH
jgi:N-acetylglucosaminyl-diphospho-decaprenol L-rhamnosyltransferase